MTILGQHTVAEVRDLMRVINFQVSQYAAQLEKIRSHRVTTSAEQAQTDKDFGEFVRLWTDTRDKQAIAMAAGMAASPNVHPTILPAEPSYKAINDLTNVRVPHWAEIKQKIDAEAKLDGLPAVDFSKQPSQNSADADSVAIKKLDGAIAAMGNPLGKPGGSDSVWRSPLGLALIGGGVLAAVGGILYIKTVTRL